MKALIISGGGAKGSFSVGVLQHLLGDLQEQYDVLCGVSVGAINAAFLGQFPFGEEKSSAHQLKEWWLKLNNDKIYTRWKPFGRLHCLWHLSFYDSTPLKSLIYENFNLDHIRASGKNVSVGTVS